MSSHFGSRELWIGRQTLAMVHSTFSGLNNTTPFYGAYSTRGSRVGRGTTWNRHLDSSLSRASITLAFVTLTFWDNAGYEAVVARLPAAYTLVVTTVEGKLCPRVRRVLNFFTQRHAIAVRSCQDSLLLGPGFAFRYVNTIGPT